jgi:hypothetical protein
MMTKSVNKGKASKAAGESAGERERMIAEAAYLRAEQRGFSGGDSVADWLAAEKEVDHHLGKAAAEPRTTRSSPRKAGPDEPASAKAGKTSTRKRTD